MSRFTVPVLERDGIRLRPFTTADTAPVIAAGRDPLIPWITTVSADGDHDAALAFIERQHGRARDGEGYSFAIADAETDEAMGQIGVWVFNPRHGILRVGYWLSARFRGRKVMSRALTLATDFGLALEGTVRIEAQIEPSNVGSQRAAASAGYRCEALNRDVLVIDGRTHDAFSYVRLRSDAASSETTTELLISGAGSIDAAELLVLQRCCWVSEAIANDTLDIPPLHETLDDVRAWINSWTVLTMRNGPRLVAAVRGRLVGETWEIGRLMVAPDLAGQGIGRRLLDQIERITPPEATTFELFTGAQSARNIDLYERAGYRIVESPSTVPGHIAGAVTLRKEVRR